MQVLENKVNVAEAEKRVQTQNGQVKKFLQTRRFVLDSLERLKNEKRALFTADCRLMRWYFCLLEALIRVGGGAVSMLGRFLFKIYI